MNDMKASGMKTRYLLRSLLLGMILLASCFVSRTPLVAQAATASPAQPTTHVAIGTQSPSGPEPGATLTVEVDTNAQSIVLTQSDGKFLSIDGTGVDIQITQNRWFVMIAYEDQNGLLFIHFELDRHT